VINNWRYTSFQEFPRDWLRSEGDFTAANPSGSVKSSEGNDAPVNTKSDAILKGNQMKRLIATAAILATLGTSAFAMVSKDQLSPNVKAQISQMVPNAELDNLSTRQVAAINGVFANSSNLRSGNNPEGKLKVILAWD
jgi:hypothetical protein